LRLLVPVFVAPALSLVFAPAFFGAAPLFASDPELATFQETPFMASGRTVPRVLLVISKDRKMFLQAYDELTDMDGDGRVDTGFNPSVKYHGYFDPSGCYAYKSDVSGSLPPHGDRSDTYYFTREKDAIDDESQEALDARRTANGVADFVKAARAVHYKTGEKIGICQNSHSGFSGHFSGNWLNYVSMTRMDVIRKILYGGHRKIDTPGRTLLESSFVPYDAHSWGTDVLSDDRWATETPMTKYYDISKFTPWPKPSPGRAHFFARVRNTYQRDADVKNYPVILYITDADKSNFYPDVSVTGRGRYYDWTLADSPNPSTWRNLNDFTVIRELTVQVEVCSASGFGADESCREYPNGALKPAGLIQKNGEGGKMYFGLLTGSYDAATRKRGGVLRAHVDGLDRSVDPTTGEIINGGLVAALDTLALAGSPVITNPTLSSTAGRQNSNYAGVNYSSTVSWGNPLGEMLFEGVRYFARLAQGATPSSPEVPIKPTPSFVPTSEYNYTRNNAKTFSAPPIGNWDAVPATDNIDCAKPIILLIAETDSDFDGDDAVNASPANLTRPMLDTVNGDMASLGTTFEMSDYLTAITKREGYDDGGAYFYSRGPADNCSPKTLSDLSEVKGLCPNSPSYEGTYSAAAVAHYGRLHDFSHGGLQTPIDIYAVTMSTSFPALDFPVLASDGSIAKRITVLPGTMSNRDAATTKGRIIGLVGYYIQDWQVDKRGTPYHVKIRVNYEDATEAIDADYGASDWDMDLLLEHTFDIVTKSSTPLSKREGTAIDKTGKFSGALKLDGNDYYYFKTPNDGTFEIEPGEAAGFVISSWKAGNSAGVWLSAGYTISGTTHDGVYMDIGHNGGVTYYATPHTCNWPAGYGSATANGTGCLQAFGTTPGFGKPDPLTAKVWRSFEFAPSGSRAGEYLAGPMFLAAKYGGFKDGNNNGLPDPGEWEGADGLPRNYFEATNISELPEKLEAAFGTIARSISTGTSTSASINSILGGGISIQTAYYPEYVDPRDESNVLRWVGTVYGLFIDKWGNLREDTDGNRKLYLKDGVDSGGSPVVGDKMVTFSSPNTPPTNPPACHVAGAPIARCEDPYGNNDPDASNAETPASVHAIESVWDFGKWLSELDPEKLLSGSRPFGSPAKKSDGRRLIYFGNPGSVSPGVPPLFNTSPESLAILEKYLIHSNFAEHLPQPETSPPTPMTREALTKKLVEYATGVDVPGWRERTVNNPWSDNPPEVVWRLGDIINSKPVIAGAPAFSYDLLYADPTYASHKSLRGARRQVAYFGSNDGFFHAVNLGFYGSLEEGVAGYAEGLDSHDIGAELWAFVPASVLPHLKWLASPDYQHSYYVDMTPSIHDIKISGEWRTVLLGGLRLGGRPIENPSKGVLGEEPEFFSEVFCFDVTDPETPPKLLWRHGAKELGLSVGKPAMVLSGDKWYAVLASGPSTDEVNAAGNLVYGSDSPYRGYSTQNARLIVLDAANGNVVNDSLIVPEPNSFFADPFVPVGKQARSGGSRLAGVWNNHVIYYGLTVSRDPSDCLDTGGVYRLKMIDSAGQPLPPARWELKKLADLAKPVTGAPNSTYDSVGNLWVFFGTGRLWGEQDLSPCAGSASPLSAAAKAACVANHENYLYGIKEPVDALGNPTFEDLTPKLASLIDVSSFKVFRPSSLSRNDWGTIRTPDGFVNYLAFRKTLMTTPSAAGYKRKMNLSDALGIGSSDTSETLFTQPKITADGDNESYVSFTTFEPNEEGGATMCSGLGNSYMYLLDTFTGLPQASFKMAAVFANQTLESDAVHGNEISGGIHTGTEKDSEVNFFKAEGKIVARTSSGDNGIFDLEIESASNFGAQAIAWREAMNTGFDVAPEIMVEGLID
jgi:type IV pilus assembly protein PilY1